MCALTAAVSFGLQFARAAGAQVIALSSSQEKMDKARALGAHHVINYREVENWEHEVLKIVRVFRPATLAALTLSGGRRQTGVASTTSSRSAAMAHSITPSVPFASAGTST
jgi:D-arabinose 1-dehydrogenase-like Zn-dependent alcohol dehydrogenase